MRITGSSKSTSIDRRRRVGAGGEELFVRAAARRGLVVGDAMRDRRDDAGGELGAGAIVEERLRLCVGDDAVELGGGEAPVEWREDRAELGAGEERLEVLAAVVCQHGDAIALADAERAGERARQPVGAAVEVPVAPAPSAQRLHERRRLGRAAGPVSGPVADVIHRFPLVLARLRPSDLAGSDWASWAVFVRLHHGVQALVVRSHHWREANRTPRARAARARRGRSRGRCGRPTCACVFCATLR